MDNRLEYKVYSVRPDRFIVTVRINGVPPRDIPYNNVDPNAGG